MDWDLIATLAPDMMRVAVSIRTGNILPSDILRRLNSSSRKNKLYFGFRELGRVVRTIFLLRYLSDAELRRTIQAATNKSERFNQFVQWVSFGGDSVIAENTRDEQRKFIKYNHLVANLLVFHNIVTLSRALNRLQSDDLKASDHALALEMAKGDAERLADSTDPLAAIERTIGWQGLEEWSKLWTRNGGHPGRQPS